MRSSEDRFRAGVRSGAPDECWEWQRSCTKAGYGQLMVDRRMAYAHRFAYQLAHGAIPPGMFVLHRCDNPRCCNPNHLFLGTHIDNMRDRESKGRSLPVRRPERLARGERNGSARLTTSRVRAIRCAAADGCALRQLAREHGVSQRAIQNIVRRKVWRHVQ